MAMDISVTLFLQETILSFLVKAEWRPARAREWTHIDQPEPVTYMQAFELTTQWLFPPPAAEATTPSTTTQEG